MAQTRPDAEGGSAAKATEASPRSDRGATKNADIQTLQTQIRELQQATKYRSLFLARLAHELRTPLTSIMGFSEILLSQEKITDAQRGFCERIQSSAQQLQSSLNQLSDLARLEAGETKLAQEEIAPGETLRDVLPALARSADKRRVRLRSSAADDLPIVITDRARVRLVIYNLLAHAISRSPEGAIVTAEAKSVPDGVAISITDVGDPIAEPARIGILAPDDNSSTGELGLSIARQNVEILGGSITASNGDGEVQLTFVLPLRLAT
ncbi:MAG TPA: HAMP domain-containing sensor histidine kinase [Pyrinomonadaceae bacterium]|nr:HAMP domain-containing sensor histidine kinase [Pyrinomonadaceae bacterium]